MISIIRGKNILSFSKFNILNIIFGNMFEHFALKFPKFQLSFLFLHGLFY
jgi:hypothetical protein